MQSTMNNASPASVPRKSVLMMNPWHARIDCQACNKIESWHSGQSFPDPMLCFRFLWNPTCNIESADISLRFTSSIVLAWSIRSSIDECFEGCWIYLSSVLDPSCLESFKGISIAGETLCHCILDCCWVGPTYTVSYSALNSGHSVRPRMHPYCYKDLDSFAQKVWVAAWQLIWLQPQLKYNNHVHHHVAKKTHVL